MNKKTVLQSGWNEFNEIVMMELDAHYEAIHSIIICN